MSGDDAGVADVRPARADFLTGLLLVALGVGALVSSLDMPRFEERQINPYTVPGLVPGVIATVIILLGALLSLRAWREQGAPTRSGGRSPDSAGRFWQTLTLTLVYAAGLVGRLPFWLATALFVFAFVALFEWQADRTLPRGQRLRALGFAAVYGGVVSAVVTWVFQDVFLIRLP